MPVGLYVVRKMSKRRTDLHFFEKFPDSFDVPAQFSSRDFQGARRFGDVLLHQSLADAFQVVGQLRYRKMYFLEPEWIVVEDTKKPGSVFRSGPFQKFFERRSPEISAFFREDAPQHVGRLSRQKRRQVRRRRGFRFVVCRKEPPFHGVSESVGDFLRLRCGKIVPPCELSGCYLYLFLRICFDADRPIFINRSFHSGDKSIPHQPIQIFTKKNF